MAEYLLVSVLLMLVIWYAIVGGSGDWLDPDKPENHGDLSTTQPPATQYPSVMNAIQAKQHQFTRDIYQP